MSATASAGTPAHRLLELGTAVGCVDGPFGELQDVIIDPQLKRVTHLVVNPDHLTGGARLVPIGLAEWTQAPAEFSLRCELETAQKLPCVQDVSQLHLGQQLPSAGAEWDVGVHDVLVMPSYDAGVMVTYQPDPAPEIMMVFDRIPKGAVELRRSSAVATSDGEEAGHVDAFLLQDGDITHLILRRRRLWRRQKLAIPVADIADLDSDSVTLALSADQLRAIARQLRIDRRGRAPALD